MKKTVVFGAGQMGTMAARLLGTDYDVLCFADNSPKKQGGTAAGLPVVSPEEAFAKAPDAVCIGVLDGERAAAMARQLRTLGFAGEVFSLGALKSFDVRLGTMRLLAEQINALGTTGAAAELGVFKGDFAACISAAFPDRMIHLFDTFEGFTERDVAVEAANGFSGAAAGDFSDTSEKAVRARLPYPERAVFHKGWFPDTFSGCENEKFAFVSIDADLYAPTASALPLFWDRMSCGGAIIVHDVNSTQFTGAGQAVSEFCCARRIFPTPVCDLHGSVILRKPFSAHDASE